jgi:hypothetical protein
MISLMTRFPMKVDEFTITLTTLLYILGRDETRALA